MKSGFVSNVIFPLFLLLAGALGVPAETISPSAALRASNERIHRFTMENGIIGLIKPDDAAPLAALQLWFGTGSIHEDEFLGAGLSHYVEHMIFKGTPTRTPGMITRELDSAGGRVNAYTTLDRTVFHTVIPSAQWEVGLDVLSDAVIHATFPEDEWEREQQVILREMAMNEDDPGRVLSRLLWSTAFRVHPVRHPVIGYREVFLQTDRDDLIAFFNRHYRPDNLIIALAGDVDPVKAERQIREAFSGFERRPRAPVVLPAEPPQLAPRVAHQVDDVELSRVAWGFHTVALHHPDAPALDLLAAMAGQGESSRLAVEIRDRRQLVHEIRAWSYTPGEPGLFGITATLDPGNEAEVVDAVEREIDRWARDPFTEEELDRARRRISIQMLRDLESMRGQADAIASGEFYAGDPRFSERYLERIESVTLDEVERVYARYLQRENKTRVLLTPELKGDPPVAGRGESSAGRVQRLELPNGIPLLVREDHRLPLVYITVASLGGVLSEEEGEQGLSKFMADLLLRGTQQRTAQEIAEAVDALGASMQPFSGMNSFGIEASGLAADLEILLELIADSLLHPVFPDAEIERQRMRQLAGLRAQRERPFQLADQLVRDHLYPAHPYRYTPNGAPDAVAQFDRETLQRFLRRHLRAGNLAISVFGGVQTGEVEAVASRAFADVPPGGRVRHELHIGERSLPVRVEERVPRQQTIFLMAYPGVDLSDERLAALEVLQSAMSGLSSELGMEIRERRGLVYFTGAFHRTGLAPGRFVLYAGTEEVSVEEVQVLMEQELRRIRDGKLSEEEIARAKAQLTGDFYALLQDNARLAQESALNELFGLGYAHAFTRDQRIAAVTGEAIQRVARELLDDQSRVIAVVLPLTGTAQNGR